MSSGSSTGDQLTWREHGLGLPRLALGLGLADAGDHVEPGLERGPHALGDGLVGLAEVLAPLGVADDRPVDAELAQHPAPRSRR